MFVGCFGVQYDLAGQAYHGAARAYPGFLTHRFYNGASLPLLDDKTAVSCVGLQDTMYIYQMRVGVILPVRVRIALSPFVPKKSTDLLPKQVVPTICRAPEE